MEKSDEEANKKANLDQTAKVYSKEENEELKEASKKQVLDQTAGIQEKQK